MPLNASQLQDLQQSESTLRSLLSKIDTMLKIEPEDQAQGEGIQVVIDYDELTRHKIDDSYRNGLISYIYSNYFDGLVSFMRRKLESSDSDVNDAYLEEFHNRWWARELSFEFVDSTEGWNRSNSCDYGRVIFRDGALVIQVPPSKFNCNTSDVVYTGVEKLLDLGDAHEAADGIGSMVPKYKVSAAEAHREFAKLQQRLKQITGEDYEFDFDFERYWVGGHVKLLESSYQLDAPRLSVQYAEQMTRRIAYYVEQFPVAKSYLNEMIHARQIRLLLGTVQDPDQFYDVYVENGVLTVKIPEKKFCYNVSDVAVSERKGNIQTLVDRFVESRVASKEPSPEQLQRLEKRKQREALAQERREQRLKAVADLKQKYESETFNPEIPPIASN